jgi:hypothetical protein
MLLEKIVTTKMRAILAKLTESGESLSNSSFTDKRFFTDSLKVVLWNESGG